jgi:hypothetical protein
MKQLFQRELTSDEFLIYNKVIHSLKETTSILIKELDNLINDYKQNNRFESSFYLDKTNLSIDEKIEYLKCLKEKISKMMECQSIRIKVANPLHPMCWCYYLTKYFEKKNNLKLKNFFESKIMHGFCVPYYPSKPIMIANYVFKHGECELHQILAHELTHSLMNAKDYNASTYDKAINDAWTLCFLF